MVEDQEEKNKRHDKTFLQLTFFGHHTWGTGHDHSKLPLNIFPPYIFCAGPHDSSDGWDTGSYPGRFSDEVDLAKRVATESDDKKRQIQ